MQRDWPGIERPHDSRLSSMLASVHVNGRPWSRNAEKQQRRS
jgi:hypothetical protein